MRVVILGAGGPTGRLLVHQALGRGHDVVAVARRPTPAPAQDRLSLTRADVTDRSSLAPVVDGADAVLSVVGARFSPEPVSVYSTGTANVLAAMRRFGPRRLVVVSSSVMDPQWRPSHEPLFNHVLDPLVNRRLGRTVHEDMRRMEALVRASDLDWTIVRPSGLFDLPEPTPYEAHEDRADGLYTARPDLAAAMLDALASDRWVRRAMAVITTARRPRLLTLLWREMASSR